MAQIRITNSKGIMVGVYHEEKKRYVQKRSKGQHALRYPPAWGMDRLILEALEKMGAEEWVIMELDSQSFWRLPLSKLREVGFERTLGGVPQWFVEHRYWTQVPFNQPALFDVEGQ